MAATAPASAAAVWGLVDRSTSGDFSAFSTDRTFNYQIEKYPLGVIAKNPSGTGVRWKLDLGEGNLLLPNSLYGETKDHVLVTFYSESKLLVALVDASSGKLLSKAIVEQAKADVHKMKALALAPDGKTIFLLQAERQGRSDWADYLVAVDLSTKQIVKRLKFKTRFTKMIVHGPTIIMFELGGVYAVDMPSAKPTWTLPSKVGILGHLIDGETIFVQTYDDLVKMDIATGRILKRVKGKCNAADPPQLVESGLLVATDGLSLYSKDLELLAQGKVSHGATSFGLRNGRAYMIESKEMSLLDARRLTPMHYAAAPEGWWFAPAPSKVDGDEFWIPMQVLGGEQPVRETWHYGPRPAQTLRLDNLPKGAAAFLAGARLEPGSPLLPVGRHVIDVLAPGANFVSIPVTVNAESPAVLSLPASAAPSVAAEPFSATLPKGLSFTELLARPSEFMAFGWKSGDLRESDLATIDSKKGLSVVAASTGRAVWTRPYQDVLRDMGLAGPNANASRNNAKTTVARWLPQSDLIIVVSNGYMPNAIAAFDGRAGAKRWAVPSYMVTLWTDPTAYEEIAAEEHLGALWYWEGRRFYVRSLVDGHLMADQEISQVTQDIDSPLFYKDRVLLLFDSKLMAFSLPNFKLLWDTKVEVHTRLSRMLEPNQVLVTEATKIRIIDLNGKVLATNGSLRGSPNDILPVIGRESVFVCSHLQNNAHALDARTLKRKWSYKADKEESACVFGISDDEVLVQDDKSINHILDRWTGKRKSAPSVSKLYDMRQTVTDASGTCIIARTNRTCFRSK